MQKLFVVCVTAAVAFLLRAETRIGIIGVDTSHATAFAKIMNVDKDPDVAGFRVTHAYKWGSRDIKSCTDRYKRHIPMLESYGVKMVDSIAELLENVDCVLLESCDGRPHLEQALEVFKSGKPCFIDKPIAADLKDAVKILDAAKAMKRPVFCSSSLRYTKAVKQAVKGDYGKIWAVNTFAPGNFEPTHSDFFWYAIHGADPLFAIMGTGCEEVTCVHTGSDDVITGRWKDGRLGVERVFADNGGYGGAIINDKSELYSLGGYEGYKVLLVEILEFFRTGKEPIPAEEIREVYAFLDAARLSKERGGKPVTLDEALRLAYDGAGEGPADDTDMLQSLLDKGGEISLPAKTYRISRKLVFRSSTHLHLAEGARVVLRPHSDCMMAGNADPAGGDHDISIEGGVWDMDNVNQAPNPSWQHYCKPPKPRLNLPKAYDPSFYRGVALYFENVSNLVVKGVTIRNPVTYAFQMCKVSHFKVDGVTLDYTTENPIKGNMDGIHLDGGCHHGRITNIRGTCWDDLVALNANDVYCSACQGPITDIEIDGLEAEYGHSAVRLLSAPDPVERIRICNVRGHFFVYAIGFTHYFPDKPRGRISDVTIENVSVGHAPPPPDMWPMQNAPLVYFTPEVEVDGLKVDGLEILPSLPEVPDRWKLKPGVVPHRLPSDSQ